VLTVVGGATRSTILMQIMADVIGCELRVPANPEATLLGAAIVAGSGLAVSALQGDERRARFASEMNSRCRLWIHPEHTYVPNAAHREEYDFWFAQYQHTYECMRGAMHATAARAKRSTQ
jgi:sugar (pentulose or hexulose) kinase